MQYHVYIALRSVEAGGTIGRPSNALTTVQAWRRAQFCVIRAARGPERNHLYVLFIYKCPTDHSRVEF